MASVLTPNAVPAKEAAPAVADNPPAPAAPAPVPVVAKAPEAPAPAAVAPVETPVAPAPVPAVDTPAPVDPYAGVVDSIVGAQPTAVQWTPEAVSIFKAATGAEDPAAFLSDVGSRLEQANLLKAEYDQIVPLKKAIESLNPQTSKIVELVLKGDIKGAQAYLKTTPAAVLEDTAASAIPKNDLVKTYFGDKFTERQWADMDDPEVDEDIRDALTTKRDLLHESAVMKHEATRAAAKEADANRKVAEKTAFENYQRGVADTIKNVKNSSLKGFVDQGTVDEITSGKFLQLFVQEDGVTPTPEAATLYLQARHFPKAVLAAEARGYARGQQEKALELTSRMPTGKMASGRDAGAPPVDVPQETMLKHSIFQKLALTT